MAVLAPRPWVSIAVACGTLASGALGCDSFDFNRVVGPAPSAAPEPRPAASSAPVPSGSSGPTAAQAPAQPKAPTFVVIAGGDVEIGGNVATYTTADAKYDALAGLRPVLEGSHLRLASLVTPIVAKAPRLKGVPPAAPRGAAAVLARSGIDVLDVSSERLWAYGKPSFTETLGALAQAGVLLGGATAEPALEIAPVEKTVAGWKVAVVSVGSLPEKSPLTAAARPHVFPADAAKLDAAVRDAKKSHDLVLVTVHGGPEYAEEPTAAQTALAKAAVDAGADAVFMAGARTPLGVTWLADHPVFYGLGNLFAEEEPRNPWTGRSFVARVAFRDGGPPAMDICPYLLVDGEPKLLAGPGRPTQEGVFRRALVRLSRGLGELTLSEPDTHSCMRISPPARPEEPAH